MNAQGLVDKATAKKCIQTIMPTVPGPVVDYALQNSPFFTNLPPSEALRQNSASSAEAEHPPFACRKMNSGNFGELSIASPKGGKYLKMAEAFTDQSKFNFTMADGATSR